MKFSLSKYFLVKIINFQYRKLKFSYLMSLENATVNKLYIFWNIQFVLFFFLFPMEQESVLIWFICGIVLLQS